EPLRVALDLGRRIRRVAYEDLLREEDDVDGVLEGVDVELAVLAAELHEVERGEVARTVVDGHVLAARVGRVDASRVRERVPAVDRRVVLDARIGALPRRRRDLPQQVARVDRRQDGAVGARGEVELAPLRRSLHERVGDAYGVVRVLILDRRPIGRVERHVVARLLEDARLALLLRLAPDELLDVGMVDVEHDHLRGAAGLATRLDRPRARVRAAHERHRAGGVAALRQLLLRRAELREVDAGAGAAAEDDALAANPVEDRLHRVVDREDEAGGALRLLLEADVEPDRAVEGCVLVDEDGLQLGLEGVALRVICEVATRGAPRDARVDDAADHLLHARLALGRAEAAAEVLLRDDVRGRLRPELRELDAALLERRAIPAGDDGVPRLPFDLVERVAPWDGEESAHAEASTLVRDGVDHLVGRRIRRVLLLNARHFRPPPTVATECFAEPPAARAGTGG